MLAAAAQTPFAFQPPTAVLVLEARSDFAAYAESRFAALGSAMVRVAETAPGASAALQTGRYDFALIDVRSAGADLDMVVSALEQRSVPFVFVAERIDPTDSGGRYSWTRIMSKPYGQTELVEAIDAAMASQDLTLTL